MQMTMEPFPDYYETLQVNLNADRETIERVYRLLVRQYHPDNLSTGDSNKFDLLTKAYRVLSDPEKRADYNARYEAARATHWNTLSEDSSVESAETDRRIYRGVLSILYLARRRDATKPGVGIVALETVLGLDQKQLEFHIWYLREKGWIQRLDTGGFAITVSGVEAVMENNLLLRRDRFLTTGKEFSDQKESGRDVETNGKSIPESLDEPYSDE